MVTSSAVGIWAGTQVHLCACAQILRKDGVLIAVCDYNRAVAADLNNGNGGVTHEAKPGFTRSASQLSAGINPDAQSLIGVITSDLITPEDLAAGAYKRARFWCALVNPQTGAFGKPLHIGFVENITQEDDKYTADFIDLRALFQNEIVQVINAEPDAAAVAAGITKGPGYAIPGLDKMLDYPPTAGEP